MAVSKNQRMVTCGRSLLEVKRIVYLGGYRQVLLTGRGGSVTFWAWMASIAVHLIVLAVFGLVKFPQSQTQLRDVPIPTATVSHVKKLIEAAPVIPKPKIKKASKAEFAGGENSAAHKLTVGRIFEAAKPGNKDLGDLAKPSVSESVYVLPGSKVLSPRIEFFGSFSDQRKVCYLVDCSGSMQGVFGRVQRKLKESIRGLQADQYFYIIFFGGDKLFESGGGQLLRAGEKAKSSAYDFIDSIQPAGLTNAPAALERAVQIRDGRGLSPSVIYFLTDGFELTAKGTQIFSQKVADLLRRFAPTTRINTIGFWPQSSDRKMLEEIARHSGGEFVLISDDEK
ncbi:MAG: VWA domain-containing protein [Phycisphaerae bacterium]|nr:VWA domain-containing protein [Phycisphaerae bacterium]